MTEPPPRNTFCSNVSQWEIFDAYQQDYELNVIIQNYRKVVSKFITGIQRKPKENEKKRTKTNQFEVKSNTRAAALVYEQVI